MEHFNQFHPGKTKGTTLEKFQELWKTQTVKALVKERRETRDPQVAFGIAETLAVGLDQSNKDYDKFVFTDQTHTTNVRKVTAEDAGNGLTREREFHDTDGLITDVPGLVLSTFYADCVPLYFVDPVHCAIGLSHSGWRGTVNRMGKATIEAMRREYGSRPEELRCAIGPSICQDCYEVSGDVAVEFERAFAGHEHEILIAKENGKYQLDQRR